MHHAQTLALLEWRFGCPLVRVPLASDLLDPIYDARGYRWRRDQAVERSQFARDGDSRNADDWQRSPFFIMLQERLPTLRRRLDGDYRRGEFPILDEVQDSGATDYFAIATRIDRK